MSQTVFDEDVWLKCSQNVVRYITEGFCHEPKLLMKVCNVSKAAAEDIHAVEEARFEQEVSGALGTVEQLSQWFGTFGGETVPFQSLQDNLGHLHGPQDEIEIVHLSLQSVEESLVRFRHELDRDVLVAFGVRLSQALSWLHVVDKVKDLGHYCVEFQGEVTEVRHHRETTQVLEKVTEQVLRHLIIQLYLDGDLQLPSDLFKVRVHGI